MQTLSERVTTPIAIALKPERQISYLVYQGMTIAAILWLLAGLWVF